MTKPQKRATSAVTALFGALVVVAFAAPVEPMVCVLECVTADDEPADTVQADTDTDAP